MKAIEAFAFLFLLPTFVLMVGCTSPLKEPATLFLDTVGGEYIQYVESDEALGPAQKTLRKTYVEDFRSAVEAAP